MLKAGWTILDERLELASGRITSTEANEQLSGGRVNSRQLPGRPGTVLHLVHFTGCTNYVAEASRWLLSFEPSAPRGHAGGSNHACRVLQCEIVLY
jgi:hypothetical protein